MKFHHEQQYGTKEYPSFWKTICESKEGKLWYKEMIKRFSRMADTPMGQPWKEQCFDIDESYECGFMSPAHWREFVRFIQEMKHTD